MKVRSLKDAVLMVKMDVITQLNTPERDSIYAPALMGPPGIGKSQATIEELSSMFDQVIVYSMGVVDSDLEFVGLPEVINKVTHRTYKQLEEDVNAEDLATKWITPDRLSFDRNKRTLIVFDDFHLIGERQQPMIMQLLTNERTIHTHKLGDNTAVVFIGNRMQDEAGSVEFYKPVISRLHIIEFDPSIEALSKEWVEYADTLVWKTKDGTVVPIHPAVIRMVSTNPSTVYTFDPDTEFEPYSCPRTLEFASRIIHTYEGTIGGESHKDFLQAHFIEIMTGLLGDQVANELRVQYQTYSKFNIDDLLQPPLTSDKRRQIQRIMASKEQVIFTFFVTRAIINRITSETVLNFDKILQLVKNRYSGDYKNIFETKVVAIVSSELAKYMKKHGLKAHKDNEEATRSEVLKLLIPGNKEYEEELVKFLMYTHPLVLRHIYKPGSSAFEVYKSFSDFSSRILSLYPSMGEVHQVIDKLSKINHYIDISREIISKGSKVDLFQSIVNSLVIGLIRRVVKRYFEINVDTFDNDMWETFMKMTYYQYYLASISDIASIKGGVFDIAKGS